MRLTTELAYAYGISLAWALPHVPRQQTTFSRLIVFGDSFSDNGNGSWIASNGTWPADPAYYGRSFSNGPKWNDLVAEVLGLKLTNLAAGGATADNSFIAGGTGPDSTIPIPSAKDQVSSFLSWDVPQPGDVFVHWIGANDILFNTSITGAQITALVNADVDRLYRAGAKNIIVANYNDITTFPATHNSSDYNVPSVKSYAEDLTDGLKNVVATYSAYAKTAFVDVGALFRNITEQPAAYGIDGEYVNPPTACLTGVYTSEGVPRNLCGDPERHLFFDSYHPVKEVHALIGQMFEAAIVALTS
ncbi:putative Phosphatidylcholine-sterol acyltransferase [Seiridium unicorne]|uniref:Phosphatidylcholine-sterol acyltransferase n=1 Tax=Seiridium unicorne TaxID=138068 RepID=A0ABR2UXJ2_9PEZI